MENNVKLVDCIDDYNKNYNQENVNIDLVSFNRDFIKGDFGNDWSIIYNFVIDIIKNSNADLLVFSGGVLALGDFINVKKSFLNMQKNGELANQDIKVVIEEWGPNRMHILGYDYDLQNFEQKFVQSSELLSKTKREGYMQGLYDKTIVDNKPFIVKEKRCAVIQCGEINFLGNKTTGVGVRGDGTEKYMGNINSLLDNKIDIFLNVVHVPMGEIHKLRAKYSYLSTAPHGEACLALCNGMIRIRGQQNSYKKIVGKSYMKNRKSLQMAFKNGNIIDEECVLISSSLEYIMRRYQI